MSGPVHYRYENASAHYEMRCVLKQFAVLKETPKGYWVAPEWVLHYSGTMIAKYKRWVSKTGRKRYCYPSKEEAWNSYAIRRDWRVRYLESQLEDAEAARLIKTPDDVVKIPGREGCVIDL